MTQPRKSGAVTALLALMLVAASADANEFEDDYIIGHAFSDSKKESEAIVWLTKAIKNKHNLLNSYVMRAHCYMIVKQLDNAIADCTAALNIYPQCRWARHQRISAYMVMHKYAEAVKDAKQCIEIDKEDDQAYALCVRAYELLGRKDLAEALREIAPGHKRNLHPYFKRSLYYADHEMYEQGVEECSMSLQLFPHDMAVLLQRAKCYIALHQTDKAIADLTAAINLWPNPPNSCCANAPIEVELLQLRAKAYLSLSRYEEARNDFTHLLLIDPASDADHFGRADVEIKLKDFEKAIADYSTVVMIHPEDEDAWRNKARVCSTIGLYKQSVADFTNSIKCDPSIADSYIGRSHAYEQLGMHNLAQADLDKARQLKAEPVHK